MTKVALVGVGYWGSKLLRNLVALKRPGDIVVVESEIERLLLATASYPGMTFVASLTEALEDPAIGAVLIATPVETHAELARQVLAADRHVFVEKPLASSLPEALELARLADARGLTLMVGHTFLFSPRVEKLLDFVNSGEMGRVHYVTSSRLNLGIHRSDANVIWDLAPHDFSIIFHLLQEFPVLAQTMAQSVVRPGVPDVAFINLTFPSGAIAQVSVSWLAPRKERQTVLVGQRNMVVYDDTNADEPIKIYDRGVTVPESPDFAANQLTYRFGGMTAPHVAAHEPLTQELSHFLQCVDGVGPCRSDGWFGVRVVQALEAADRSWRTGGAPVEIGDTTVVLAS